MSEAIDLLTSAPCELLALGEPTHPTRDPAFASVRNELFAALAGRGFRSIALETDRIAAFAVDDYVQGGPGDIDEVMRSGFSHGFGELSANRDLVTWMRAYNSGRPAAERLAFCGFDVPAENTSAPSPRESLSIASDYLGRDRDFLDLLGPDDKWERPEAILNAAASPGAAPEAARVHAIADDMLNELHARTPELVAATSLGDWYRARARLYAGIGLLRYHRHAARAIGEGRRIEGLLAVRAVLMAQNLLDIRDAEQRRGPTLVFAHNGHLQRNRSSMTVAGMRLGWNPAGSIAGELLGTRYRVAVGSFGRSRALGLGEPEPGTYEGRLQNRVRTWGAVAAREAAGARTRTDTRPEQVYSPLDEATVAAADWIVHLNA